MKADGGKCVEYEIHSDLKIAHLALNNNRSLTSTNPIDKGHICILTKSKIFWHIHFCLFELLKNLYTICM